MARDYAAEYRRRIERGLASGKTRQEARGHRDEIRAPGAESTYAARQTRSIARRLRDHDEGLSRPDSITLAYRLTDRWGIPNTRKLLDYRDRAATLYEDRDPDYADAADQMGAWYDEINGRSTITALIQDRHLDDWEEYTYIDFGDSPDYTISLFYH